MNSLKKGIFLNSARPFVYNSISKSNTVTYNVFNTLQIKSNVLIIKSSTKMTTSNYLKKYMLLTSED